MTSGPPLLVLDFDGVVCDALAECAAVTYVAASAPGEPPTLEAVVGGLPTEYLDRFASVRPYCRTLVDFMVTNVVARPVTSRAEFEAARTSAGETLLRAQAARAQAARNRWRATEPARWLELHEPFAGVAELITQESGRVAVVSNKDAASIGDILRHLGLLAHVTDIVGDCADKPAAVARLLGRDGTATFVDDNVANVLAVSVVPQVRSLWATWGYHSPEDVVTARERGVVPLALAELARVA